MNGGVNEGVRGCVHGEESRERITIEFAEVVVIECSTARRPQWQMRGNGYLV